MRSTFRAGVLGLILGFGGCSVGTPVSVGGDGQALAVVGYRVQGAWLSSLELAPFVASGEVAQVREPRRLGTGPLTDDDRFRYAVLTLEPGFWGFARGRTGLPLLGSAKVWCRPLTFRVDAGEAVYLGDLVLRRGGRDGPELVGYSRNEAAARAAFEEATGEAPPLRQVMPRNTRIDWSGAGLTELQPAAAGADVAARCTETLRGRRN